MYFLWCAVLERDIILYSLTLLQATRNVSKKCQTKFLSGHYHPSVQARGVMRHLALLGGIMVEGVMVRGCHDGEAGEHLLILLLTMFLCSVYSACAAKWLFMKQNDSPYKENLSAIAPFVPWKSITGNSNY